MQMSFDMNDGYVNTLTVADFNLFSRAIQGDTHRFEHIERFIKVKIYCNVLFSLHLDPTFEIYPLEFGLILVGELRPQSRVFSSLAG